VNPLRTVGGRLALALLLVVTGALAIVYIVVVPSYQHSLVGARVADLQRSLRSIVELRPTKTYLTKEWVDEDAAPLAKSLNARVVVLRYRSSTLTPVSDSNSGHARDTQNDSIALKAVMTRKPERGTVTRRDEPFAEAAYPIQGTNAVVLLTSSLHNDLESVNVVRNRVVIAGAIATAFAILLGYALATLFARRIRRLEAAAERIANGRFDENVVDPAPDELGQLARAFERMRLRLASLERARGEFIANASHELRTPLFSLGGFLELLDSEELDNETRAEFMSAMREQVSRLTKLATDLLDLSRVDAGRLTVASESVDLAAVAELLATEFGPRAAATDHALEVDAVDRPCARADEERVLQIGRVLVENALVHTAPGGVIEVSAGSERGSAVLAVSDDGPGIPQESREQIFERFYRLEGTVASGSGLGLAIARELAALMGGRIEVESKPGWTRFALVLPADAADRLHASTLV
jgi:two-component system, OmpR family, sensor kinase